MSLADCVLTEEVRDDKNNLDPDLGNNNGGWMGAAHHARPCEAV